MGRPSKMPSPTRIAQQVKAGMTNAEIAVAYGVSGKTVETFLSQHSIRRRPPVELPPDNAVIACIAAGMSIRAIATKFGMSPDTIRRQIDSGKLRAKVAVVPLDERDKIRAPSPGPEKIVNDQGISLPRIVCIYGPYEATP